MNWPNRLTIFRIVLVPVFVSAVMYYRLDLALYVFVLSAVTDGLDGYLARTLDQKTRFGAIIDPIADKLLNGSAYICLSMVSGLPEYLTMPVYVPILVISRDVIILLGAVAIYLLSGRIDVRPTALGKVTTCFQMATIIAVLLRFSHSAWLWNTMALVTFISGIDYLRIGSAVINGKNQQCPDSLHSRKT